MKKAKLLLLTLLSVLGMTTAGAETVSPYEVDFNSSITTSVHDFAVASNWGHIVGSYKDSWGDTYYMSYTYKGDEGIGESGTLLAYRQYAYDQSDPSSASVVYDLLVTPVISGEVKMYVKPSTSASSSIPAFVEIYDVDETGATRAGLIQRFTVDDGFAADETNEGWYTVTLSLSEAKHIGIRAQYVYMDNFSATSAEIAKEAKLTITGLSNVESGTYYPLQKEDGSVDISLKVTLKNSGDVDLKAGDDNYTLTLVKKAYYGSTETVYDDATFAIDQDIAAGESATIVANFTAPSTLGTGWMYLKVKENISETTSSAMVQTQVQEYASKFIFDIAGSNYYSSSSATTKPISFGKISEATTLEYEIYNSGSAPLTINSFTLPEPYTSDAPTGEFIVSGGEKKVIAITLPATTPGIFDGTLEIAYTNFGKEQATYTLGITGTVTDPSKNLITFDNGKTGDEANGQFPAGSIHTDYVYISKETSGDDVNFYLQSVNSPTTKFITPLLTATAGESFTYDTWHSSYNSSSAVTVYTSKDRINWTQVDRQTYYSGIGSTPNTFTVTIDEAGDYYLAFELAGNAVLDDIYGLTLAAEPDHDWYVMDSDVPTEGTQNKPYTATISVKNISAEADAIATATLYVDGEAVAVQENVNLEANTKTAAEGTGRNDYSNVEDPVEIALTFNPHVTGEVEAYIELKNESLTVETEKVNVTIAEEKIESEIAVDPKSTTSTGLLNLNWNNSESVSLYTPEVLEAAGLKEGDVIETIIYKGYRTADAYNTTLSVWYEETEDATQTAPENGIYVTDGMTQLLNESHEWVKGGDASALVNLIEINLATPITYNGKALRFVVRSESSSYKQAYFEATSISGNGTSYYHRNDNATTFTTESWNTTGNLPAIHFGLKVEPKTLSGQVYDDVTEEPVEGATVTLYNEENDVEYTATTDADGIYTISVVQDALSYTATIEAEGYKTLVGSDTYTFENSVEQSFGLASLIEKIKVSVSESEYATLYYETKNLSIPEDVKAYTAKVEDKNIVLTKVEDMIPAGTPVILNGTQGDYIFTVVETDPFPFENPTSWKADANTAVTAATNYADDDLLTVKTVYASTLKKNGQTIDGENFTHYIQVRVKDFPTAEKPNGTEQSGSTPLVFTAKKNVKLKVFFRRQKGSEGYNVNDNKDIRLYDENFDVLDGVLSIEYYSPTDVDPEAYGYGTKVYDLKAGNTYTLCAKGTTINFYGFAYAEVEEETLDNDLVGTEDALTVTDDAANKYYVLSWKDSNKNPDELGFYFWQNSTDGHSMQIGPHKAYLKISAAAGSNKGYVFWLGADAINNISMDAISDTDTIYNLSGIRVNANNLHKGIYIVNGKKVVIK